MGHYTYYSPCLSESIISSLTDCCCQRPQRACISYCTICALMPDKDLTRLGENPPDVQLVPRCVRKTVPCCDGSCKLSRGRAIALFDGRNSAPTGTMEKMVNNWIQMPLCGWYDNTLCFLQKVRSGHPKIVTNDDTYCRVTFQRERQAEYTVFTEGKYSPLWRQPGSQLRMIFSLKVYSRKCITLLRGQH